MRSAGQKGAQEMAGKCRVEFSNRQKDMPADKQVRDLIRACCAQTLRYEGVAFACLVSVSFVTKDEIQALNAESRKVDAVTDVLSFPLEEFSKGVPEGYRPVISPLPLGDIVLCPAKAVEQAEQYGHSLVREIAFLSVHSMLHLLGYDHMTKEDERQMFDRQEAILRELSISRDRPGDGAGAARGKEGAGDR